MTIRQRPEGPEGGLKGPAGPGQPRSRGHRGTAGVLAAAGAALMLLVGAPAAQAHDRLLSSDPADGAALASLPAQAALTFSAEVEQVGTAVELQDADGQAVAAPPTVVAGRDVTAELPGDLAGGDYTLVYRVTSSDGHPISGQVAFTLEAPAQAPTTAPPTAPTPTTPAPAPSTSAAPTAPAADGSTPAASQTSAEQDDDTGAPWALIAAVVAIGLAAAAGAVVRRRGTATGR